MDTELGYNGDLAVDENGRIGYVSGQDEIRQRLYIHLSAKEGSYMYNRELGSGIIEAYKSGADAVQIEAKARKALDGIPQAEVAGVEITQEGVTVFVEAFGNTFDIWIRGSESE